MYVKHENCWKYLKNSNYAGISEFKITISSRVERSELQFTLRCEWQCPFTVIEMANFLLLSSRWQFHSLVDNKVQKNHDFFLLKIDFLPP